MAPRNDALAVVSRAATARGPISVLSGVRIEALADRMVLAATDTELAIRVAAPADVSQAGVGVAPARTLLELVKRLSDGRMAIETGDDPTICLQSADGAYWLNALSVDDFPAIPVPALTAPVRVERGALVDAFARVGRVAARDMSRPVYTGILVGVEAGTLSMVAMDGHRLAVMSVDAADSGELAPTLVPARALAELARLSSGHDAVEVSVTDNLIVFEAGEHRITSRRLSGQFQAWEQLLGGEFAHEAAIDRMRLLAAVERAGVLAQRGTPVVLDFHDDRVEISVASADVGQASEHIPIAPPGASIRIAFNPSYLVDGLQIIDGDVVHFRMNDGLRPAVMSGDLTDVTYLLAPVRVNSQR